MNAPTAEEQLPPLKWIQPAQYESWLRKVGDPRWYEHRYHQGAEDRQMVSAIRELRDTRDQLLAALRENREKDARIALLTELDAACEEQRNWLITEKTAAEAKLRAVSDALKGKLTERAHESIRDFHRTLYYYRPDDVDALLARIRAIVEGK